MITIPTIVLTFVCSVLIAGCTKTEDAPKPVDDSAAGRAAATIQPSSSPINDSDKSNADLARLRQLKEIEEARNKSSSQSTKEFADGVQRGAAAPIRQIK